MAGEVAECLRTHKAAVAAGKAAWMAEPLPPRASKRRAGDYRHDRGVWLRRDGMEARGCGWRSDVAGSPVEVLLDPAFVSDAVEAAGQFGRTAVVRAVPDARMAGKVTGPVVIEGGGEFGERVVAVIMPMAAD